MDEKIKVCKNCSANNPSEATFCGCCGHKFDEFNQGAVLNGEDVYSSNQADNGFRNDRISEYEFFTYVGKNHNRFMPSFRKFFLGSKASFSPLVFLLSLLITPVAGCFWFLHRKMYKIGSILLAISLTLTIAGSAVSYFMFDEIMDYLKSIGKLTQSSVSLDSSKKIAPVKNNTNAYIKGINNDYYDDYYDYDDYDDYDDYYDDDYDNDYDDYYNDDYYDDDYNDDYGDSFGSNYNFDEQLDEQLIENLTKLTAKYNLILTPIGLCQIALAILMGIFAKYWYFKDAVRKITQIKQKNPSPSSINQIAAAGGTSCIAWVITLIAFVVASFIYSFALTMSIVTEIFNLFL